MRDLVPVVPVELLAAVPRLAALVLLALPVVRPVPPAPVADWSLSESLGALDRLSLGVGVGLALEDGDVPLGVGDALCAGEELCEGWLVIVPAGFGLDVQADELVPADGTRLLEGFDPCRVCVRPGPPLPPVC